MPKFILPIGMAENRSASTSDMLPGGPFQAAQEALAGRAGIDADTVLPGCVTQAVQRLSIEFAGRHSDAVIQAVAVVCHENLRQAAVPAGDLDELVERSTRERLVNPPRTAADIAWTRALTHWTAEPARQGTGAAVDRLGRER